MDLEKRVANLEKLVNSLIKTINNNKFYTDADINGTRQSVSAVTPYVFQKKAYIGDFCTRFDNVPAGLISVSVEDELGNYIESSFLTSGDVVEVTFEPLEVPATIILKIDKV